MSAGGSSGSSDSRFERKGSASTSSFRTLTDDQNNKFNTAFSAVQPNGANAAVDQVLSNRMSGSVGNTPHQANLNSLLASTTPQSPIVGNESLKAQAAVNPYGSDYDVNTFNRYATEVGKAQSQVRSGPAMTRGGTAAQGFAQAEVANDLGMNREQVLTGNRQADAQVSQGAGGLFGQLQASRNRDALSGIGIGQQNYHAVNSDQMKASQIASERTKMYLDLVPTFTSLASVMNGTETNDLSGRGAQTSSSMGAGVNLCCFIFMESYNGLLPWYVRAYRDAHAAENTQRRNGYIKMSKWLVPAMRVSEGARTLTNYLLVKPLTSYGKWKLADGKLGWVFKPVVCFWFKVWELTGKK
tara:strand:- start:19903 stop:20970 length:1068 start_codon:yes stop_codon:yes gene_type:complete